MKKTALTLALIGIATSAFAYSDSDKTGAITGLIMFVGSILSLVLFVKIWIMTESVDELKKKICPRKLGNKELLKQMLKLEYLGRSDEAKKLLDENLTNEVFAKIFLVDKTVDYKKTEISKIIDKYEKYYKILNAEMPSEIKNVDVEKVFTQYRSV